MDSLGNLLPDIRENAKDNISPMTVLLWPGCIIYSTFILKLLSGELVLKLSQCMVSKFRKYYGDGIYGKNQKSWNMYQGKEVPGSSWRKGEVLWGLQQGIAGGLGLCSGQMEGGETVEPEGGRPPTPPPSCLHSRPLEEQSGSIGSVVE